MTRQPLAVALLFVAISACGLPGCDTIQYCRGTAPYTAAELPSLMLAPLPAPDPGRIRPAAERVMRGSRKGAKDWDDVGSRLLHKVKEFQLPGGYSTDQHWIAWDGIANHRPLYVVQQVSNEASLLMGDHRDRTDVYDTETGELLASWGSAGATYVLLFHYGIRVEPAQIDGVPGVRRIMAREAEPADLRFELSEVRMLVAGVLGWGRSNHRTYIQFLWIPIVTGAEKP